MMKQYAVAAIGCLLLSMPVRAQDGAFWAEAAALPDLAQAKPGPAPVALFGAALKGQWSGTLTYRDYRSDKRVVLPTSASIGGDGGAVNLTWVYDDGPGKTVRSNDAWELSADGRQIRMDKAGGPLLVSQYRAGDGLDFSLVATGDGTENEVAVPVRAVLLRRGATLTISRSAQLPGQPWLLRHVYRLTLESHN